MADTSLPFSAILPFGRIFTGVLLLWKWKLLDAGGGACFIWRQSGSRIGCFAVLTACFAELVMWKREILV
jgi:hypothetical protein